jgi:aminoglycoside phosphotransferase (APT) family kinase protein
MGDVVEEPLSGGLSTGIVRVGATVRRPRHDRSDVVQALLRHLADAGFTGAPRPLGYDEQGREVVSWIEGVVPDDSPALLSDAQLVGVTALVRAFHDASASFPGVPDGQVMCHGDLGPHNTVFRGDEAVGLIDWDDAIFPAPRIVDFAHAVWCCADLALDAVPVANQARRLRLMCAGYPGMTPRAVVEELTDRFRRARADHLAHGRTGGVEVFDGLLAWMGEHGQELVAAAERDVGTVSATTAVARGSRCESGAVPPL